MEIFKNNECKKILNGIKRTMRRHEFATNFPFRIIMLMVEVVRSKKERLESLVNTLLNMLNSKRALLLSANIFENHFLNGLLNAIEDCKNVLSSIDEVRNVVLKTCKKYEKLDKHEACEFWENFLKGNKSEPEEHWRIIETMKTGLESVQNELNFFSELVEKIVEKFPKFATKKEKLEEIIEKSNASFSPH